VRQRRAKIIAWGLAGVVVLVSIARMILWAADLNAAPGLSDLVDAIGWGLAIPVAFSGLAALIVARQPGNRVGWLLMVVGLAVNSPTGLMLDAIAHPQSLSLWLWLLVWVDGWSWALVILPIFLIPLHFPGGHVMPGRWKWVTRAAEGLWVSLMVILAVSSDIGPEGGSWSFPNPIGFLSDELLNGPVVYAFGAVLVVTISASVASLFVRYRQSEGTERQQIRWLLLAGAFLVLAYGSIYFTAPSDFELSGIQNMVLVLSILGIPVAIAVAIFRYRLWDLDVIVNRALVYGPLTTVLAGIFAVLIAVSSELAKQVFGTQSQALGAAISAVVVAVIFQPMRSRVQSFVDQRFYPQKADLASGLVEILPGFWPLLDRQTLVSAAQDHARRALGIAHAAFFFGSSDGVFERVSLDASPSDGPSRLELTRQQTGELLKKRVIANTNGGPAAGFVPIHVDRGRTTELLGLLAVGKRENGRGYSGDELKALADLGGKIGLAFRAVEMTESRGRSTHQEAPAGRSRELLAPQSSG